MHYNAWLRISFKHNRHSNQTPNFDLSKNDKITILAGWGKRRREDIGVRVLSLIYHNKKSINNA